MKGLIITKLLTEPITVYPDAWQHVDKAQGHNGSFPSGKSLNVI
jgi:hypothetical protein